MPGLSASGLPPEMLHPGDTLVHYCRAFVAGNPKGYHVALVVRVDATEGIEFPIPVDTSDVMY
ncbi:hypothetical protein PC116_g16453 [Phytophthora cactorum]|uniref:Uncharacterized protein n=1 Tax=Phytophthora cactorum TaxID=29920 RepID=A0A8T1KIC0_9STRA|nr:hypothetical protein Pcac1_g2518 [Phytophthora cactorum]KAG2900031.1 hypothetical protein PC114_g13680 [Phytophthora cactorum]KAG2918277.1 hypothetical protein PC115_g10490 [Phytophthora cactorum]KAG2933251.1 hypothetical protein PC117_g12914 [Phytophthora cactorum]KAG2977698.1 hypothetical protein PC118_g12721 [Phytophthora cactorum]